MAQIVPRGITGLDRLLTQLADYPQFVHDEMEALTRRHARALISSSGTTPGIIQITPPHSAGKRGRAAKEQGEMSITADLLGLKLNRNKHQRTAGVFMVMPDDLLAKNAKVYGKSQNVRLFVKKNGTVYGTDRRLFRPNASTAEMYAHHQSMRRKSDGKVSTAGGATRDIGRWKFIDQMVVSRSAYLRYERFILPRVGMLAATILKAYDGRYGPLAGVPAWIRRHDHTWGVGLIRDRITTNSMVVTIGLDAGGLNKEMQRRFDAALEYRRKAFILDAPRHLRRAAIASGLLPG